MWELGGAKNRPAHSSFYTISRRDIHSFSQGCLFLKTGLMSLSTPLQDTSWVTPVVPYLISFFPSTTGTETQVPLAYSTQAQHETFAAGMGRGGRQQLHLQQWMLPCSMRLPGVGSSPLHRGICGSSEVFRESPELPWLEGSGSIF